MDQFNKTNSGDKTFQIPLIRMRGKNATKNLLVNPGGPGVGGLDFVRGGGPKLSKIVGEDFHIVGFDPRGVASSTPQATCYVDDESREKLKPRRVSDLIKDSPYMYAWTTNYVRSCRENAPEQFKYVNTPQTAADMNSIIDALGQKNMLYWGISYGSLLGQVYATLFPERSERIILDGVVSQADWFERPVDSMRYIDTSAVVDGFFEECVRAGDACALSPYGKTGPELRENVTTVINRLYRNPASAYLNSTVYGVVDDFDVRIRAIFREMSTPVHWPLLAQRLADLQAGNATSIFLSYVNDAEIGGVPEANWAVMMNDGKSGAEFWPQPRIKLLEKLLPYFDKYRFALGDMMDFHVRQQWSIPKTHSYVPKDEVKTKKPVLLLSTTNDPGCPHAAAEAAQKSFVGSRLIAAEAYGHASVAMPSLCMAKYIGEYLTSGILPDENVLCKIDGAYFPRAEEIAYTAQEQEPLARRRV
ncbi:hypothetical protein NLG97_g4598 [Lecanicillium saksenae]|uniref:Uncharacterized protein n=1 Tax=Lecanicillium saksenae TaxID=468837 RepID=A0ACC1QXZ7_9HYPO|nr:hypothetical protein NLG97_g4598 [Lecanicillium saksenae]